jgi:hypothetical protein
VSREAMPPRPAASRNSSRRSASPASLILRLRAMVCSCRLQIKRRFRRRD